MSLPPIARIEPRPDETETTTWEPALRLDGADVVLGWQQRPWTAGEAQARADAAARRAARLRASAAVTWLRQRPAEVARTVVVTSANAVAVLDNTLDDLAEICDGLADLITVLRLDRPPAAEGDPPQ